MGKKYLIDSNTLIEYSGRLLSVPGQDFIAAIIDKQFNISFINKIEVLGHTIANEQLRNFINQANVYHVSDAIINKTIELRKSLKIKIPDAIIAATALVNELILVTRNTNDFRNITGLELVNPWEIS